MSSPRKFENLKFSLYEKASEMMMFESYYRGGAWDGCAEDDRREHPEHAGQP